MPRLRWLTVDVGSWQGAPLGLVVRALIAGLSMCFCIYSIAAGYPEEAFPKGWIETLRLKASYDIAP